MEKLKKSINELIIKIPNIDSEKLLANLKNEIHKIKETPKV